MRRLCAELPQRPAEHVLHAGIRARLPGMRGVGAASARRSMFVAMRYVALPS